MADCKLAENKNRLSCHWLIANSLRTKTDYLANPPILFNAPVTFQNYQKILVENGIYKQFANTFVVAAVSTIIAVVFGSMAAYSTVRGRIAKKIRNFFGLWFMIQKMYPAIATAIPVYLVMRHLRLIDTRFALIIMNTSFNLPLVIWLMMGFFEQIPLELEESAKIDGIWLMMGFFEQIPLELEESAKIDGANFVQRFFRIVFPVTTPGIIASAILAFVGAWNEFLFAVILSVNRSKTLPVVIAGFITDRGLEWGPMAATAVITLLPILVVVWALQKNFVQGLAMGAVKG